jgi:2-polyprenyl-3-methyl-5-hydroxy-6-metoxy-1,4-benzoquinol methylase
LTYSQVRALIAELTLIPTIPMISTSYERRSDYRLASPEDHFIVSLLKTHIDQILAAHAKPTKPNASVLDVGCGRQPFRHRLEEMGYNYMSLDAEQTQDNDVDVIGLIDRELPLEIKMYGKFDFILCTEVMEHVADWHTAFSNFSDLLEPGGKIFITCPHMYQLHEEPHDYWRPTPYIFDYFAKKHQFKILCQLNAGDAWDVLGTVLANLQTEAATRQWSHRILNKLVSKARRILLKSLLEGRLQSALKVKGNLYQANIVLLEKE